MRTFTPSHVLAYLAAFISISAFNSELFAQQPPSQFRIEAKVGDLVPLPNGALGAIQDFYPTPSPSGNFAPRESVGTLTESGDLLMSAKVRYQLLNGTTLDKATWWKKNIFSCEMTPVLRVDDFVPTGLGFPDTAVFSANPDKLLVTKRGNVVFLTTVNTGAATEKAVFCTDRSSVMAKLIKVGDTLTGGGTVTRVSSLTQAYDTPQDGRCAIVAQIGADFGAGEVTPLLARADGISISLVSPLQGAIAPGIASGSFANSSIGLLHSNDAGDLLLIRNVRQTAPTPRTFDVAYRSRHGTPLEMLLFEGQQLGGSLAGMQVTQFQRGNPNQTYPDQQPVMNASGEVAIWSRVFDGQSSFLAVWTNRGNSQAFHFRPGNFIANQDDSSLAVAGISEYGIADDGTLYAWGTLRSNIPLAPNEGAYFIVPPDSSQHQVAFREGESVFGSPTNSVLSPEAFLRVVENGFRGSYPLVAGIDNYLSISRIGSNAATDIPALIVRGASGLIKLMQQGEAFPGSTLLVTSLGDSLTRLSAGKHILLQPTLSDNGVNRPSVAYVDDTRRPQLVAREGGSFVLDANYSGTVDDFWIPNSINNFGGRVANEITPQGIVPIGLRLLRTGDNRRVIGTFSASACPADINRSGNVSVQDIFDGLIRYFAGDFDFNRSCSTSVQDLFDFLSSYFEGC